MHNPWSRLNVQLEIITLKNKFTIQHKLSNHFKMKKQHQFKLIISKQSKKYTQQWTFHLKFHNILTLCKKMIWVHGLTFWGVWCVQDLVKLNWKGCKICGNVCTTHPNTVGVWIHTSSLLKDNELSDPMFLCLLFAPTLAMMFNAT